jgi:hypothetical protein
LHGPIIVNAYKHCPFVAKIEALLQCTCILLIPKRHLEHIKLEKFMESKGLKYFHNVKTWWVFMLAPLKCVLCLYKSIVVKMNENNARNAPT